LPLPFGIALPKPRCAGNICLRPWRFEIGAGAKGPWSHRAEARCLLSALSLEPRAASGVSSRPWRHTSRSQGEIVLAPCPWSSLPAGQGLFCGPVEPIGLTHPHDQAWPARKRRRTASDSVQITFGGQSRNYNLYDPTQASTPIGAGLAVPGLGVTLSDHPVIIQIL
jgi:hypothetical protein